MSKEKNNLVGEISCPREIRGYSAYELAVIHGFNGTEAEFVAQYTKNKEYTDEKINESKQYVDNALLSKADIVMENGETCLKVGNTLISESKLNKLMALLPQEISGTWVFTTEYPTNPSGDIDQTVSFVSNGKRYDRMVFYYGDGALSYCNDDTSFVLYSMGEIYCTGADKIVDFGTEPQEVSRDFMAFMMANATQVPLSRAYTTYTGYSTDEYGNPLPYATFNFEEGMTWAEAIANPTYYPLISSACGGGAYADGEYVSNEYTCGGYLYYADMTPVKATDKIISDYSYYLYC